MAIPANTQLSNSNIKPFFYKITKHNSTDVISTIKLLTNDSVNQEYMNKVIKSITERGYTFYGFIYAPKSEVVTKKVIGKQGYFFKLTTYNKKCDFIWHDRNTNVFMFWGEKNNLINSMNSIRYRISKVSSQEKQSKKLAHPSKSSVTQLEDKMNKMSVDNRNE